MLRKVSILVASSTLSLMTITAIAQPAPSPREPVTREATATRAAAMFARLDANSDGQLTQADRDARAETRGDARFERIDTNGDDAISRAEFDAQRDQRHERRQAASAEGRGGHAMTRGEGRHGQMQGRQMGRMMGGGRDMVRTADADSNGVVTQAEFTAAMLTRFDAADADKDGTVSHDERRAMRQQARAQSAS